MESKIINSLPCEDIIRARSVCTDFRAIIDGSNPGTYLLKKEIKQRNGLKIEVLGATGHSMKSLACAEFMAQKRAVILASELDDSSKETAVDMLYRSGGAHLTPELIAQERTAILASGLINCCKAIAVGKLYEASRAHLPSELIAQERAAILTSKPAVYFKADVVR